MFPQRNLNPRFQQHIARARRIRIIGGALLVTCLLIGTGAALTQTQLPHQLATTLKPIASNVGASLSQLPSAVSEITPQFHFEGSQLAATATSFPQSIAEKVRNLFCRWLGCGSDTLIAQQPPQPSIQQRATLPQNVKQPGSIPQTSPSDVARSATTTTQVVVSSAPPVSPAPASQPIIQHTNTIIQSGITEALLDARLAALEASIAQRMIATENANATSFRSVSQSSGSSSSGSVAANTIIGTITNAIDTASAAISSLTATELVATNATTSNLYVSGTATIGSGTGVLQSNAGVVSALANGSNGQVLKVVGGNLEWSTDLTGGGGGASAWATTTDDLALYPADSTDVVLIGASATTTTGNIVEVNGNSLLRGSLTIYGAATAPTFIATSSAATSTFPRLNVSGSLGLGADYVTDLTGSGLTISSGALTLDTSGTWSGTLGGYSATQLIASGFSTSSADAWSATRNFFASSSADYWQTTRNFFSTTSADVWKSERNFFATSSADYWRSQADFFSTSSVNYWKSVTDLFSTSSATYHLGTLDKGFFFSTTSADYWKSVTSFFSTSSAAYFASVGLAFSTTSSDYWQSQRDFFSTSSAIYFAHSSTTIPKTYTANTFAGLQTFANASTSILSASTLCLSTDCRTSWPTAGSSFDYLFPNNATTTTLAFNGGLLSVGSTTIAGNATTTGMLGVGSLFLNNSRFTSLLGSGLLNTSGTLTLDTSGDWSGTLGGYTAPQLLAGSFSTTSADVWKSERNFFATTSADYWKSVTDLFSTTSATYFAHSSTTIPKLYSSNTWTGANTFSALTLGSLNGPLHANAGVLSATSSIGILYGGTGLTSAPTYGQLLVGNSSGGYTLTATSSLGISGGASLTGTTGQVAFFSGTDTAVGTSTLFIATSGNVGIGTTNPQFGSLTIESTPSSGLANLMLGRATAVSGSEAASLTLAGNGIEHAGFSWVPNSTNADSRLSITMGGNAGPGSNPTLMSILGNGNVGIGTTTPWAKLSINPNGISGPSFVIGSSTATSFIVTNGGNVGIGKIAPSYRLDVSGDINFTGAIREDGNEIFASMIAPFAGSCPTGWSEYTAARGRTVVGTPSGGTNAGTVGSALTDLGTRTITDVPSHLHTVDPPSTNTNTTGAHTHGGVRTDSGSGSITGGSGAQAGSTASAGDHSHTLDIAQFNSGSTGVASVDVTMPYIQLTYCQKAAGADIAEWIPASEDIGKATIISADPDNREKVVASRTAYDNSVVGVVATQPGWLLGQEAKGSVQMALAGRVPMRVSLKNGEIKIGDPITSSSIPGVGMKATKAGPIVGKAMEAVNETSAVTACGDPLTGRTEQCATALVFVNVSWYSPTVDVQDDYASQAANNYHEPLSIGADFETGDVVTLEYRYPQKQGDATRTEKTGYLMPAVPGGFAAGVISTEIGGPGELLRRVRENNKITQELRLIESGKAEMRISPLSPPINVGDPLTISPKDQGMAVRADAAGFIIGRALEEWGPSNGKKTISVLLDASWYVPPNDETEHVHDDTDVETDGSLLADLLEKIFAWLADAQNRVENLFAKNLYAENIEAKRGTFDELCVKDDAGIPVCVTGTQLRSLLSGSVLGASASSNDNEPPIDAEPVDERAAAIDATAPSTSPASDEAAADQTSPPAPDVMTTSPANDNAPPPSAEAI